MGTSVDPALEVKYLSEKQDVSFEDAWYDAVEPTHFWMQWRHRVFLNMVADLGLTQRPLRALEIGGGNGVARDLIERDTPWTVDMADLNAVALDMARPGRGETLLYNALDLLPDRVGQYDVVILFDVVEHIENPRPFLEAAVAHLRPGGHLFINVPALQPLYSIFDKVLGHFRRYNRATLRGELVGLPTRILECRYWGLLLLPVLVARTTLFNLTRKNDDPKRIAQEGVKPPNGFAATVLHSLRRIETSLLKRPVLGTSVMAAAVKTDDARDQG